ncbi:MAG: nucleotidyltransferase family protein [Pelistega sp.]|nr:nucleotidyltransferase family protein [Pelistega sp.]
MRPSEILASNRDAVLAIFAKYPKLVNPRVFGSVASGQDTELSDIDFLVDDLPQATLFDLGGLYVELNELLGVNVDVVTPGDLPQKFRDIVIKEAVPL